MGLLSSISSGIKKTVSNIKTGFEELPKNVSKTLNQISGVVTNPITAVTQGVGAAESKFVEAKPVTNVVKTITNVGTVVAIISAGAAPGAAANVVKSLIPSSTKGKIVAGLVAPIAIGAAISAPSKTAEAILSAPASLVNVGSNIGNIIEDPSLKNVKNLVTENPVIVGGAIAAGAVTAGVGITKAVSNFLNTRAINENTEALLEGSKTALPLTNETSLPINAAFPNATPMKNQTPVTPATRIVTTSQKGQRRKKIAKSGEPISQKVNIIVSNRSLSTGIRTEKKYIKRELLAT